ncbi:hypothetical protein MBANPS3_004891 [Mucor bainieri]
MEYFFTTNLKDWKFSAIVLHYLIKADGDREAATHELKNDLEMMMNSGLLNVKATNKIRAYHMEFDKLLTMVRWPRAKTLKALTASTHITSNNHAEHIGVVVGSIGTQNITTNNKNIGSSSSSSRKRKQPHDTSDSEESQVSGDTDFSTTDKTEAESDDEHGKDAEKLDFLVGGEGRITIHEQDYVWAIDNINISANFHAFRNRCIDTLERGNVSINHTQELSVSALNGILWLDDKNRRYYGLDAQHWALAKKEASQRYPKAESLAFPEIAKIAEVSISSFLAQQVLADDFEAGERQADAWYCSTVTSNDFDMKLIAKTVLDLIQKFRKTNATEMKEPLFCSFLVESIVTPFLCLDEDCLTLLGNTDESPGSKMRRQQGGRRPDLSVAAEFNNQSAMPFVCEVKSTQFMNSLKPTDDKHPDFIKLCNLMKDELDRIIAVDEKVVYGLLVEGKTDAKNRIVYAQSVLSAA